MAWCYYNKPHSTFFEVWIIDFMNLEHLLFLFIDVITSFDLFLDFSLLKFALFLFALDKFIVMSRNSESMFLNDAILKHKVNEPYFRRPFTFHHHDT